MSIRLVRAVAIVSFLIVCGVLVLWHAESERRRARDEWERIEANRSPPVDYGDPAGSFLSPHKLTTQEIEARVANPETPSLMPGKTVWACFARVTWLRNDCRVVLHWWFEELPQDNPNGPRLRLDFDRSEHELNHQDYLGRLPAKCRPFDLPEQLTPGRQYAMISKDTAECPGTAKHGAIFITPPEMRFTAAGK